VLIGLLTISMMYCLYSLVMYVRWLKIVFLGLVHHSLYTVHERIARVIMSSAN